MEKYLPCYFGMGIMTFSTASAINLMAGKNPLLTVISVLGAGFTWPLSIPLMTSKYLTS